MFKDLGAPIKEGMLQSHLIGPDENGIFNTVYFSISQCEDSVLFLKYNIDTKEIAQYRARNNPDIRSKMGAWISTLASNDCVYLGTYYEGHLLRYDIKKDEFTDLGQALPGETYIMGLCDDGKGHVYGSTFSGGKLFRMDLKTEQIEDLGNFDQESLYCRNPHITKSGKIVTVLGTKQVKVAVYDPDTGEKKVIPYPKKQPGTLSIFRNEKGDIFIKIGNDLPYLVTDGPLCDMDLKEVCEEQAKPADKVFYDGRKLAAMTNKSLTIQLTDGTFEEHALKYDSSGLMLWMVHKGPDDKIYGSSALPLRMFRYDPNTGKSVNLGNPATTDGEIYSMTNYEGKLYIASYSGAIISVYDPNKPWNFGFEPSNNPREIGKIGYGQNRPTSMITAVNGMIYIASVPTYGETSGALTEFNPKTDEFSVWRGIVDDQSVYVLDNITGTRFICAATSNEVGTGADIPTGDARVFIWDIDKKEKVKEIRPVKGSKNIVSVKYYKGLIYGLTGDGNLFIYDYIKDDVLTVKKLPVRRAIWPGMDITDQGIIYGAGDDKLFRYDPEKDLFKIVAETTGWNLGFYMDKENNRIYGTPGARLVCYDIGD